MTLITFCPTVQAQENPSRVADPVVWGLYAKLPGATLRNINLSSEVKTWRWGNGNEIIEDIGSGDTRNFKPGHNAGDLLITETNKNGRVLSSWTGKVAADGSVLILPEKTGLFGYSPYRARLLGSELVYDGFRMKNDQVVSTGVWLRMTGQFAAAGAPPATNPAATKSTATLSINHQNKAYIDFLASLSGKAWFYKSSTDARSSTFKRIGDMAVEVTRIDAIQGKRKIIKSIIKLDLLNEVIVTNTDSGPANKVRASVQPDGWFEVNPVIDENVPALEREAMIKNSRSKERLSPTGALETVYANLPGSSSAPISNEAALLALVTALGEQRSVAANPSGKPPAASALQDPKLKPQASHSANGKSAAGGALIVVSVPKTPRPVLPTQNAKTGEEFMFCQKVKPGGFEGHSGALFFSAIAKVVVRYREIQPASANFDADLNAAYGTYPGSVCTSNKDRAELERTLQDRLNVPTYRPYKKVMTGILPRN